ncbi:MAG: thiamine pyrophosphate-binding protein [Burkholderiaceae bacterium]
MPAHAPTATGALMPGREAFLRLLASEGVTHLFGNPGTTELPIMHALPDVPGLRYVLGLQESIVVAMADGYARASGELVACNVHVAPGLGNALGSLYTAAYSNTPMIITAGQQEQGHGLTEPLLAGPLVAMAEPLVKWAIEVTRLEDLPRIVRRAAKIATTAPCGPVFISLPGDILNASAHLDLSAPTRLDMSAVPSAERLQALAQRILAAKNPVLLAGREIVDSDAFDAAAEFATALGAPVFQQTVPTGAHFPSEHPLYQGDLSRNQSQVRDVLSPFDLLISLGADMLRMSVHSETDAMPHGLELMHIGLNDHEIGKNYAVAHAVLADLRETLTALTPVLVEQGGSALAASATERSAHWAANNWSVKRQGLAETAGALAANEPMAPEWLMHHLVKSLPANAIVVEEGLVSTRSLLKHLPYVDRHSFFGNTSGGIGWALPATVGISLAHPQRRVLSIIGDGSSMYSIQALWTAAHLKLPITYVIANNGGYRIIKERLRAFHGSEHYIGMDFKDPAIDFQQMAAGLGMPAVRVANATELDAALDRAHGSDGPLLIEAMVETGP